MQHKNDAASGLASTMVLVLGGGLIAAADGVDPSCRDGARVRAVDGAHLVLLPLAVAGMLILIQSSLALAFSLAGIVAVRCFWNC